MTLSVYLGWSISSSLCVLHPCWSGRCLPCILHSQCVFREIFLEMERGDWTDCWPADFHLWCLRQLPWSGRQAGLDIGCIKCLPILARKLSGVCGSLKGPIMPVRNAITVYFPFLGSAGFGFRVWETEAWDLFESFKSMMFVHSYSLLRNHLQHFSSGTKLHLGLENWSYHCKYNPYA